MLVFFVQTNDVPAGSKTDGRIIVKIGSCVKPDTNKKGEVVVLQKCSCPPAS